MAEAGLTHGGFYAHFKSKDELVAAAIGQMFDESRARVRARDRRARSGRRRCSPTSTFYLSARHRDARGGGCPIAALASDLPRLADAVARGSSPPGCGAWPMRWPSKLAQLGHADAARRGALDGGRAGRCAVAGAGRTGSASVPTRSWRRRKAQLIRRLGLEAHGMSMVSEIGARPGRPRPAGGLHGRRQAPGHRRRAGLRPGRGGRGHGGVRRRARVRMPTTRWAWCMAASSPPCSIPPAVARCIPRSRRSRPTRRWS